MENNNNFPQAFPPVNALWNYICNEDWNARYNQFMDFVVTMCAFMAAMYTVARTNWVKYNCTQRCVNGWNLVVEIATEIWQVLQVVYNYTRQTLIPGVINIYQNGMDIYNYFRGDYLIEM